MQGFV